MNLSPDVLILVVVLSMITGLVICFFGYALFKFVIALGGFLIFGSLAGAVAQATSNDPMITLLAGIIGGLIGIALALALYYLGIFLVGAAAGILLAITLATSNGASPNDTALILFALGGGLLALVFQKFMIILSTAFGGAWTVVVGAAHFIGTGLYTQNLEQALDALGSTIYLLGIAWLILGFAGMVTQYKTTKGDTSESPPPASE